MMGFIHLSFVMLIPGDFLNLAKPCKINSMFFMFLFSTMFLQISPFSQDLTHPMANLSAFGCCRYSAGKIFIFNGPFNGCIREPLKGSNQNPHLLGFSGHLHLPRCGRKYRLNASHVASCTGGRPTKPCNKTRKTWRFYYTFYKDRELWNWTLKIEGYEFLSWFTFTPWLVLFTASLTPGNTGFWKRKSMGFSAVKLWVCIALNVFVLSRWWIFFLRKPIKLRELKHRNIVVRNLFQLTLSKPNRWCIRNICDFTIEFWPCDWDGALSSFVSQKQLKLYHLDWTVVNDDTWVL